MSGQYLVAHVGHTHKWDEHICWWKPDSKGYTICVDKAGRYTEEKARSICRSSECIAVRVDAAESIARSTPYYRRSDGTLAKLYDGGPYRPVENSSKAWAAINPHNPALQCQITPSCAASAASPNERRVRRD